MRPLRIIVLVLATLSSLAFGAVEPPSEKAMAAACKVPDSLPTRTIKLPTDAPSLKDRMLWLASYAFSKPVEFGITLACVPHGRLKPESFDFIASKPELEYRKVALADGSVIHHHLGGRGTQETFYSTTLVTKSGPCDYTLVISRKPDLKDADLPIDIKNAGVELIQLLTKQP